MHRGRLTCMVLASATIAIGAAASAAGATPFGLPLGTAPITALPSYPYDCSVVPEPVLGPVPLSGPTGQPASSCIWIHVPTPAQIQAFGGRNVSLEPPGTGTVTQVQIAVGPTTGPMQVVVMRALYQNTATPGRPNDACCTPVARSQVFTPAANQINTIPVNLPVKEDATPPPENITTIADFDTLGLAVLQPGVPLPMYYTGDTSQPADFVWNTSTPSTVTPGFSTDTGGFFVAMSGEWTAGGAGGTGGGGAGGGGGGAGGGGAGGGGAGGGGLPGVAIPLDFGTRTAPVRNGNANVGLRCAGSVVCIGQLLLQSAAARGSQLLHASDQPAAAAATAAAAKKPITYGTASFKIAAGKHKQIAVHLSRSARTQIAKHRSTKVWANVKLSTGAVRSFSIRITLRR